MEKTKELSREKLSNGFLKIERVYYKRGDKQFSYEVVNRGDAVAGMLFNTNTQKYIFVKQFRPGANTEIVEIIAGTMDIDGESAENCFKREAIEETGYSVSACQLICSSYASPGGSTEKMYIFQSITDGTKVSMGGGVGDENIEIVEFSKQELIENLEILSEDLKTFVAVMHELKSGPMAY